MSGVQSGRAELAVKVVVEGWHNWPGAPAHRAYLAHRHRHLFHVTARCLAEHDEREIEFHDLQDRVRGLLRVMGSSEGQFGGMSCEAIARQVAEALARGYGRPFSVEVNEDGECGATVQAQPSV